MRIVDYALAMDGGTQIVELELDAGETMMIGLDGRIDSPVSGRQLFTGSSPESPDAQLPPIGGSEEAEVIALLEKWLDQTQGFLRRGALIGSDPSALDGQDLRDRMAIQSIRRHLPTPKNAMSTY